MHNSVGEALEIGIEVEVDGTVKMMVKMMEKRKTERALEGVFVPSCTDERATLRDKFLTFTGDFFSKSEPSRPEICVRNPAEL